MQLLWQRLQGRNAHQVGRQLLAEMVQPLPEIRITERGKPYFVGSDLHFSISHTKNHVFCCVSRRKVGIDAEQIGRSIDPRLASRYLSDSERGRYLSAQDPNDTLLRLWVLKESWAKCTGRGIGNYLKNTDLDPFDPRIQQIDGCYVAVTEE